MRGVSDVFRPNTENTDVPFMEIGELNKNQFRVKKRKEKKELNFGHVKLCMPVRNPSELLE